MPDTTNENESPHKSWLPLYLSIALLGGLVFIANTGKSTDSLETGLLYGSLISLLVFVIYVWWDKRKS